jgi:2-dehydropantoate 2-reductase
VGHVDLVIYTVKMYHNKDAIRAIRPMMGPESVVLTLQNGVDNVALLVKAFGRGRVMPGMVVVQARIRRPGVIEQLGSVGSAVFGELEPVITPRATRMHEVFQRAGWKVELTDNAMGAVWRKFIYLAGTAGVNAVVQVPYGEMRTIPETRATVLEACREIVSVARALGAPVADDVMAGVEKQFDEFPAGGFASLAKDFAAGNRVELEGITGAVVRLGEQAGVSTPVNRTIYALLKPRAIAIEKSLA